jgi:hypothetical protein
MKNFQRRRRIWLVQASVSPPRNLNTVQFQLTKASCEMPTLEVIIKELHAHSAAPVSAFAKQNAAKDQPMYTEDCDQVSAAFVYE